jgi:hypothetical protein
MNEILSKTERVALILQRLREEAPADSRAEAIALMARIFREVEEAHSGVPEWPQHKDRLYPPVAEMEASVEGKPWLKRYRHTGHYTLVADNGAIVIRVLLRGEKDGKRVIVGERTELDKAGADGRRVDDFEPW